MAPRAQSDSSDRTRRERDLYLRLLQLGRQEELEPFLEEALSLVVDLAGAERGYLALHLAHVEQADRGCDLDFLSAPRTGTAVPV